MRKSGTKPRGRGRRRKCENSDDSNNEDGSPMKLKIRIDGPKKKKAEIEVKEINENACSIEEEVVSEEFVVDHLEGEHFEPDAGYFEEVVDNQDRFEDCDDVDTGAADVKHEDDYDGDVNNDDVDDDDDDKDDASDDEKKWLDALESGQLNENGEVKHLDKSNVALTARQRALLYGEKFEDLLELSSIQPAEMTEEQIMKRKKKALRRKQLEVEKTERDKKETLDRLLKKQDSKLKTCKNLPSKDSANDRPFFKYTNNAEGIQLFIPSGYDLPIQKRSPTKPKPPTLCGVEGCTNPKRYSCSTTKVSLCSLECYKKNMANLSSSPLEESPLARPSVHLATVS